MRYRWFLGVLLATGLAAISLSAAAQTGPGVFPDRGVGVLSADPGYGERWSTTIFPFGNYTGTVSGEAVFCRTYLHFPVEVRPDAQVFIAVLSVYVDDFWPGPGGAPISVYPVLADWTVEGVDWYDMGAWPPLGAPVATTMVTSDGGWFTWDIIGLVEGWVSGARPNYGLALAAADPSAVTDNWAAARRLSADDPETQPFLNLSLGWPEIVTVHPPPISPTPSPSPPPLPTPTPAPVLLPETGGSGAGANTAWVIVLLGLALAMAGWLARRR
ncbi:MAG: DNRLRE domain-containing protein, partial [Anaerolineae bacterium]